MSLQKVRIALDWYPNTLHAGLLLAVENGYYAEQGLEVELLSVTDDGYACYPLDKLLQGKADIGMAPTEHGFYYNEVKQTEKLMAIGAVNAADASAVSYKLGHGISRPKDLDGKVIACYGTYFEEQIMQAMIKADGGQGVFTVSKPGKLELWDHFTSGQADACWMFPCWEGALAAATGTALGTFKLSDYGIPYAQSPVFFVKEAFVAEYGSTIQRFITATAKGYHQVVRDTEASLSTLLSMDMVPVKHEAVWRVGLETLKHQILNENGLWGAYNTTLADTWQEWLLDAGCLERVLA